MYLSITFAFTWVLWGSQALYVNAIITHEPVKVLAQWYTYGAWGPFIAAFVIAFMKSGSQGIKRLFTQTIHPTYQKRWLVPTFLLFPTIVGAPLLILYSLGKPLPDMPEFSILVAIISFFVILVSAGPLQEEYGWRGTFHDTLQKRIKPLWASIITGFIWGIWHLPLFFIPEQGFYYDRPIWGLILSTILISILFTWIYNNTNRNMLLMLIFHAMWNFSHYWLPTIQADTSGQLYFVLLTLTVVGVVFIDKKALLEKR